MRIPTICGVIERRMLINYRVDPTVMARQLPPPFRPQLVHDCALAGICLIRLASVRPRWSPVPYGLRSENAAHRVAVEWDDESSGETRRGVYIPRRDTNKWLNVLVGGRIFPGVHHRATFSVREAGSRYELSMQSGDGLASVAVAAAVGEHLPKSSIFASLEEASAFFERGSLGYSPSHNANRFDGLELRCKTWQMEPLNVERVASSYFDDESRFPRGSATFDHALLMRNIEHEWHGRGELCCR